MTENDQQVGNEQKVDEEILAEREDRGLPDDVPIFEGDDLASLVEALLFASSEPLAPERLAEICKVQQAEIDQVIEKLVAKYAGSVSGFELSRVAGKLQLRTDPRFAPYVRIMRAGRPKRLSHAALETLAVIAYRQPVVRSDIEQIRGVDVTPTLKTLIDRRLVRILGHQASVGQPALYGTTEEFLKLFGLNSLSELPTLRDIKEFERDPGEPIEDAGDVDSDIGGTNGEQPMEAESVALSDSRTVRGGAVDGGEIVSAGVDGERGESAGEASGGQQEPQQAE